MKSDTLDHPIISETEMLELIEGFRSRTLPAEKWTHEAHLTTALWFLSNYSKDEATCFLRSGIIAYNISTGGENTPAGGYHETITLFWIEIIDRFVRNHPNLKFPALCNTFLRSTEASKELPMKYYSRDLLFSTRARARWVNPDLAPRRGQPIVSIHPIEPFEPINP